LFASGGIAMCQVALKWPEVVMGMKEVVMGMKMDG
jgi:hypothetical protein